MRFNPGRKMKRLIHTSFELNA
ncbi:hypothetical protein MESS2_1500011 [Mesorhizobium metallidurans STM 2683]|uniref:Uncharacterized protein n=1 Tax=Mesorhizobium metallidurans STM 2683 TaxID=1297569 RepID=M5F029_9HYPH|nr:hypothetical protein MESS2_1500011 [Mesorhizobium metallidurans STM 2683]